ncbi:histidinol dehydrogenase [Marinicella sp. W31]|uniref:histidinol dehydrogenase n=1 Tax=Marinicella sp. W31 TaxID=3023713 RepID=UPI003757901B
MSGEIIQARKYKRPQLKNQTNITATVAEILEDIQNNGDDAVNRWSEQIDNKPARLITLKPFEDYDLSQRLSSAIEAAHRRIKRFCRFQLQQLTDQSFEDEVGSFSSVYRPIERIGAYVPGGQFPLISTALMTLTPAQVAGCPVRIACSPSEHPALLAAASLAGATAFISLGGAQAIGALSYGFQNIDPVNMIVGPGNAYVNSAKAQVQHRTKIDTLAGPSELLIYANQVQNPEWILLDALAQAEHDPNAVSVVVSEKQDILQQLLDACQQHTEGAKLLANEQIVFIQAMDETEAIEFINAYAPEHLMVCGHAFSLNKLTNYGSLFVGENAAVAFGDYCSGPNHTLPTAGAAKFSGGLSVHQFMKVLTIQDISDDGRQQMARLAATLAEAEGLIFHQQSAEIRK